MQLARNNSDRKKYHVSFLKLRFNGPLLKEWRLSVLYRRIRVGRHFGRGGPAEPARRSARLVVPRVRARGLRPGRAPAAAPAAARRHRRLPQVISCIIRRQRLTNTKHSNILWGANSHQHVLPFCLLNPFFVVYLQTRYYSCLSPCKHMYLKKIYT